MPSQVARNAMEESLKCDCVNLHLKLNSDSDIVDVNEELNFFRKGSHKRHHLWLQ
jgi:hypothetical protein